MKPAVRDGLSRRAGRRLWRETSGLLDALAPMGASGGRSEPTVYYGWRKAPGLDGTSRGGFVKLQHLQRAFPNAPGASNIVYLVSSALPPRPNLLVSAAGLRGMRLVWNQNGVAYPGWHGPDWEAVNGRMASLMRRARYVFYQSAFCRMASERFLGPCVGSSEVLPNPVDTSHFKPSDPPVRPEALVILAGGTNYQRHRFEVAALTLRCLLDVRAEVRLRFVGQPVWAPQAPEEAS